MAARVVGCPSQALAGGALLTHVWAGFLQGVQLEGVSPGVAVLGNVVFVAAAVVLLVAAVRHTGRRAEPDPRSAGQA